MCKVRVREREDSKVLIGSAWRRVVWGVGEVVV